MYFLCDESGVFDFQQKPGKEWRNVIVGGVLLNYEARRWWLKNYRCYPRKAQHYKGEEQILDVLQTLIDLKIKACAHIIHLTTPLEKVQEYQKFLLKPLFDKVIDQPKSLQASLQSHLQRLDAMGPSSFAKTWTLLELLTEGVSLFIKSADRQRTQDQRNLTIIIDDQNNEMIPALKYFIYFFLNCRSQEGIFSFQNRPKMYDKYIRKNGSNTFFDLTKLIRIIVDAQANLDDKHIELRIADVISNFINKAVKGSLSVDACSLLNKIMEPIRQMHFNADTSEYSSKVPAHVCPGLNLLDLL